MENGIWKRHAGRRLASFLAATSTFPGLSIPLPAPLPVGSMENEDTVSARFVYGFDLGDNRRCALAPPQCGGDGCMDIIWLHGQALAVKNLEVEQKVPRGCEINRSGPRERGLERMARRERGASPAGSPAHLPPLLLFQSILFLNLGKQSLRNFRTFPLRPELCRASHRTVFHRQDKKDLYLVLVFSATREPGSRSQREQQKTTVHRWCPSNVGICDS